MALRRLRDAQRFVEAQTNFSKFEVLELVGTGANGVVFRCRARDPKVKGEMALKIVINYGADPQVCAVASMLTAAPVGLLTVSECFVPRWFLVSHCFDCGLLFSTCCRGSCYSFRCCWAQPSKSRVQFHVFHHTATLLKFSGSSGRPQFHKRFLMCAPTS